MSAAQVRAGRRGDGQAQHPPGGFAGGVHPAAQLSSPTAAGRVVLASDFKRGGVGKDWDAAAAGGSLTEAAWVAAAPASPARAEHSHLMKAAV